MRRQSLLSVAAASAGTIALVAALALVSLALAEPAASPPTPAPSLASQGQALFMAKGCLTCHRHGVFTEPRPLPAFAPASVQDLTSYRRDAVFLRQWLDNPAAVRPGTAMPDLDLSPAEIEALIAFLNDESTHR